MVALDWKPDNRKLSQFGWISLIGFGLIGAFVGWKFGFFAEQKWLVPGIFWGIGGLSAILALIFPAGLRPLYWVLMGISAVIGPIISTTVLLVIFLLIFTPVALFFRLVGRDALHRKLEPEAESYWIDAKPMPEAKRYFRQY